MHRRHGPFGNFDFSLSLLTERLGYSSSKWRRYIWEEIYLCISYLPLADFSAQVAYLYCTTKLTLYIQYLFDINIPRHSVSVQSTYLPNILCKLHREVHNPFHVIAEKHNVIATA